MNSNMILAALLGVFVASAWAGRADECEIKGHGVLRGFDSVRQRIKVPCKYRATTLRCQGYEVSVTPGHAFDGFTRYFVDTLWISIKNVGTGEFWKGRTSTKIAQDHFDTLSDPFNMKVSNLKQKNAKWDVVMEGDKGKRTVTLSVSDADFEISFIPYDFDLSLKANKKAGVTIACDQPSYLEGYPDSFCGNATSNRVVRERKKDLGLQSMTQVVLYDVLMANTHQTNAKCEIAGNVLHKCSDTSLAIRQCSSLVNYAKHTKCLAKYHYEPMTVFVWCLKYYCKNDAFACHNMKDAISGCYNVHGLSKVKCPPPP